jgi:DNA-binding FadR family transcriptional regulator
MAEGMPASVRAFRTRDSRFHVAIARASANGLLLEAVSASRVAFFRWADAAWERIDWASLPAAERDFGARHRPIAEAVARADPDAAEQAMTAHLVEGEAQFEAVIGYRRRG